MKAAAKKANAQRYFITRFATLPLSPFTISLCILFLAFAVRFHLLGAQSFWNDEGNSYVQATRSFAEIAAHAARDIHPPGYYWLLAVWRAITGETEFALRALSAFASVLTVAFTYSLGRRLFSPIAGLVAALFVTLNTFSIYYAQEARMYALMALWSVAAMWALVGFFTPYPLSHKGREGQVQWALALALFNAAGLWTQYAYPFVMLAQAVVFLGWAFSKLRASGKLRLNSSPFVGRSAGTFPLEVRGFVLANLLTIALYLPWLPTAWTQLTTWPNTGDSTLFSAALGQIVGWMTLGMTYNANDASWVAVALLLIVFGLRVRRVQSSPAWRLLLPLMWVVLPIVFFLILGLFREANLKFLLPSQIGVALLMGRGVWVLWTLTPHASSLFVQLAPRFAAVAGLIGLTVALWSGLYPLYHEYRRDDYRAIAARITADSRPGDAIILNAPNQEEVFRYYYRGETPIFPLPAGLGGDDSVTQAAVRQIIAEYNRVFVLFWGEAERDPNRMVEGTLDSEAYEVSGEWYGNVRLVHYATPAEMTIEHESGARFGDHITLERYALSSDTVQPGDALQLRLEWRTDAALTTRYKVFVQLLDENGMLAAQRDSEPGGGLALTTTWQPGETVIDQHALIIPSYLSSVHYTLIIGLYHENNPLERLSVGTADYLVLNEIKVQG